jgi:hypothetical protein
LDTKGSEHDKENTVRIDTDHAKAAVIQAAELRPKTGLQHAAALSNILMGGLRLAIFTHDKRASEGLWMVPPCSVAWGKSL